VTAREQRLVFGEVADAYDEVRAGYPRVLAQAVLDYAGDCAGDGAGPVTDHLVEVGAGTGKATAAFVGFGAPITCLEPDPAMAAVLRARFTGVPVDVVVSTFEDWTPPPVGVPLLYSAQAWHWVDPRRRWELAYEALAPGGTLALFGHHYAFADSALETSLNEVYDRIAPELRDEHSPGWLAADENWMYAEMTRAQRFVDVTSMAFRAVVPYPTPRYLTLLSTFSNHRMLPAGRRAALHAGIAEVVDRYGGVVDTALETALIMGRRAR
jgi:SAM-dependent methyltransferase